MNAEAFSVGRSRGRGIPAGTISTTTQCTIKVIADVPVLVKPLARAFRWRKLLETGRYATIDGLASAEKINAPYVSRVLRLTPEIVEAILDGRQSPEMALPVLMGPFPVRWHRQISLISFRNADDEAL